MPARLPLADHDPALRQDDARCDGNHAHPSIPPYCSTSILRRQPEIRAKSAPPAISGAPDARVLTRARQSAIMSMWTGEQAPPPGAAPQIFNLSRGSFARRAKPQNPADSAPPATPTTICLSFLRKLWPQIVQGSDFCSGKWDFPTQKSPPAPDALVAGLDFDAKGLRPSRALPGGRRPVCGQRPRSIQMGGSP